MKIFLDMDGVLMDFDGHCASFGRKYTGPVYVHKPKSEWTPEQLHDDTITREIMASNTFWRTMPWLSDGWLLWRFCEKYEPHVLTATPKDITYRDRCAEDKYDSILKFYDPSFPISRFHAVLRSEKKRFAHRTHILVDDNQDNCDEWVAAGGIAILHTSATDTIRKLEEFIAALQPPKIALRPRNSAERKAEPIHSGVLRYFPDALAAVARLSKKGNDKHNPGEPLHWAREKSTDHADCIVRHDLTPELVDPDTNEIEAVARAWRSLADLQLLEEKRLIAAGIMPYSGIVP